MVPQLFVEVRVGDWDSRYSGTVPPNRPRRDLPFPFSPGRPAADRRISRLEGNGAARERRFALCEGLSQSGLRPHSQFARRNGLGAPVRAPTSR